GAGNVIANNSLAGVALNGPSARNNLVLGNFIGTDPTGTASIGNGVGILMEGGANGNTIGGTATGTGNVIAFNSGAGVALVNTGPTGNTIRENSIHDNAGMGIDLGNDGVTLNDAGDADAGP